jgi:lipopolysaccharide transport system ATP-binding protein
VFDVRNNEGLVLFAAQDTDATWRRRPRPTGRYISTGWIPGNLLNEGVIYVGVAIWTLYPERCHCYEQDVVTVHVVDSLDEDSARGGWPYAVPGVMRPLCKWETQYLGIAEQGQIQTFSQQG